MGCLYALLDLPAHIDHLRKTLPGRFGFAGSLVLLFVCLLLIVPVGWAFWAFDQVPTWDWTLPIRAQLAAPLANSRAIEDATGQVLAVDIEGNIVTLAAGDASGTITLGVVLSALIWLFNLAPTLIQLSFPSLARGIPPLAVLLKVAIIFDYVTDFPAMWQAVTAYTWPDWGLFTGLVQFGVCALATLLVSMVLQVVLGVLVFAAGVCIWNMYIGGAPRVVQAALSDR